MKEYSCEGLTVKWNPEKCIHAQECVKGLPQVFNRERKPWINMQGASPEEIMRVIDRCPSGALTYRQKEPQFGEEDVSSGTCASIKIVKNGPLLVEGDCPLLDPEGKIMAKQGAYSLCRCGSSKKKPFCDGTHIKIGFDDSG